MDRNLTLSKNVYAGLISMSCKLAQTARARARFVTLSLSIKNLFWGNLIEADCSLPSVRDLPVRQ